MIVTHFKIFSVRPIIEYADVVWDNVCIFPCTADEQGKIHLEVATKLVSIDNLYKETVWEPLASRGRQHKLKSFFKWLEAYVAYEENQTEPPIFVILCGLCFQRQSLFTFILFYCSWCCAV